MKIFTIHDSKAEAFSAPIVIRNKGEALRGLTEVVNDATHQYGKYPSDYTLFEIGEWNDLTGNITTYDAKISVCNLIELKSTI